MAARARTAALLFAGAGALTGVALGCILHVAPALTLAVTDALKAETRRHMATMAALPSGVANDYETMITKLHPSIQKRLFARRAKQAEVTRALAEGRPPCQHRCPGGPPFCAIKAGLHTIKPLCRRSEVCGPMKDILAGRAPEPPTPRSSPWIPANYTGGKPPLPPSARRVTAAARAAYIDDYIV